MIAGDPYKSSAPAAGQATLCDVVRERATVNGDSIAYTFLADGGADARSITWSQLDHRASALGALLQQKGAGGERVLLTLPSGLNFIESLFACWYAGAVAVPVSLPRHQRLKHRLDGIIADADARFAIGATGTRQLLDTGGTSAAYLTWVDVDVPVDPIATTAKLGTAHQPIAMLQYTSGSTGAPRGVIVTHTNLMRNSALIALACGHGPGKTIGGWLPLFHDMGLIGLVLQAAYSGARCVLMPPERFLMRPWLWLQMISDYGVCSSAAPNFAYDLCVDRIGPEQKARLDLSGWRNALNGSEPVRPATLDRFAAAFAPCGFRPAAFFPCYGLAEATLFVTGPGEVRQPARRTAGGALLANNESGGHVACGHAFGDTKLAIVDPQTNRPVPVGTTGEIWVAGGSVTDGYWRNPEATAATFNGRLEATNLHANDLELIDLDLIDLNATVAQDEPAISWLRTGDLGFIADGELFITGRLRELIIIAGRNHFPVDLERTVESADPAIAPSAVAAFSVDSGGVERLIIVAEVRREYGKATGTEVAPSLDPETVCRNVRAAVAGEHDIAPHDVVLLRSGALPRTTSGKITRRSTHDAYLNRTLEQIGDASHARAAN